MSVLENRTQIISIPNLRDGDPEEIARMVSVHSPAIFRLALKMLGNEQDAEDVLQETFFKALRSLQTFEERSSLSTWLYRITINESLMVLRKRKNNLVELDDPLEDNESVQAPVEIVDFCCLPERELADSESKEFLNLAVSRLTPPLRAVFLLRDVEGQSVKETADTLRVSESVVKTRLLRARLKLREELSLYYKERMGKQ